jgi:SAM-dependent methyltransferase
METHCRNEFQITPFAEFYEAITDSFIDVGGAAASLKRYLPRGAELFEIGLGTGYFASMFTADGYIVKGIQPQDELLPILKRKHEDIGIVAECKLEDYKFLELHETIVSHSSVFLFTRHEIAFGRHGEVLTTYIFQSFITEREEVVRCLEKTLRALTPGGRLFINIQTNPPPFATINCADHQLIFQMTRCAYFLELGLVEKTFRFTYQGHSYHVNDHRFCETYAEFAEQVSRLGFKAAVSEDRYWIIVSRA